MRRAAASIMANIAEGNARLTRKDRVNFFNIARSSAVELDSFFDLCLDLNYITQDHYTKLTEQLNKTAYLLKKLTTSQS